MVADDKQPGTYLASAVVISLAVIAMHMCFLAPAAAQRQNSDARLWEDPLNAISKSLGEVHKDEREEQCVPSSLTATPKAEHLAVCNSPLLEADEETLVMGVTVSGASEESERRLRIRYAVIAGLDRGGFEPRDSRHLGFFLWRQAEDQIIVPVAYEWFQKASTDKNRQGFAERILVLWLKEEAFADSPLRRFSELKAFIFHQDTKGAPNSAGPSKQQVDSRLVIIGPYSSDTLRDMVSETERCGAPENCKNKLYANLNNVRFYAYGASASERWLLPHNDSSSIRTYFEHFGIQFQRTLATDDSLARGIVHELALRGLNPWSQETDIALISEWDTFYGQTLPKAVSLEYGRGEDAGPWIHQLTYLKGLDGKLPSAKRIEEGKQTSVDLDRPVGRGQFDYLRRMTEQLHQLDDELRERKSRGGIKAVGILGSDVFDKLLLLRALRREFPGAIFFTTDFDELLTLQSERPWTRNLIISSSFGPRLSDQYQGRFPPFRDSYQTSAFLATQLAIGDRWRETPDVPHIFPDELDVQLSVSRLFEIERGGDMLLVPGPPPLPENWEEGECSKDSEHRRCNPSIASDRMEGNVQPEIQLLFPRLKPSRQGGLATSLMVAAVITLMSLVFRKVRRGVAVEVALVSFGLAATALCFAYWEPFADFLTENGDGEPIVMLQGVSVWPVVLLRVIGITLSSYFIWRAQKSLRKNLAEIGAEMDLDLPKKQTFWHKRLLRNGAFDFSLGRDQAAPNAPLNVQTAWEAYALQEQPWRRTIRACLYVVIMNFMAVYVLVPFFGVYTLSTRGVFAKYAYVWTTFSDFILMQFLNFFILDATFFCLLFVNKLRRAETEWPAKTVEKFKARLRLQTELVQDGIDLEFIAKRTRCIGSLIYYPFLLIALLTASVSAGNQSYFQPLLISEGISFSFVLGCAIMLWRVATAARAAAKQKLTEEINSAKENRAKDDMIGVDARKDVDDKNRDPKQLEILLKWVDQLREGAFRRFSEQPLVRAVFLPVLTALVGPIVIDLIKELLEKMILG